jgi:hypothetical protein
VRHLGGDEHVVARKSAPAQRLSGIVLGAVLAGGVDMAIAAYEGRQDGFDGDLMHSTGAVACGRNGRARGSGNARAAKTPVVVVIRLPFFWTQPAAGHTVIEVSLI